MKSLLKSSFAGLATLMLCAAFSSSSQAAFKLMLSDGVTTVTITDGGAGDINPAVGAITFLGAVGTNWVVNVTTGLSKPVLPTSPILARIDLSSVNVTSTGPGTITIKLTDTDFTLDGVDWKLINSIGGTTDGSVTAQGCIDLGNAEFDFSGPCTALQGPFAGIAFSGTAVIDVVGQAAAFSISEIVVITHTGSGQSTSFDKETRVVPEPGTLGLFGLGLLGLLGLGLASRRRVV